MWNTYFKKNPVKDSIKESVQFAANFVNAKLHSLEKVLQERVSFVILNENQVNFRSHEVV